MKKFLSFLLGLSLFLIPFAVGLGTYYFKDRQYREINRMHYQMTDYAKNILYNRYHLNKNNVHCELHDWLNMNDQYRCTFPLSGSDGIPQLHEVYCIYNENCYNPGGLIL